MVSEGSLPCTQEPSTDPYPKADQFKTPHPISLWSIWILSTHIYLGLPRGSFPSDVPTTNLYADLLFPFMLHSKSTSSSLTLSLCLDLETIRSCEAPHCAVSSDMLSLHIPFGPNTNSQYPLLSRLRSLLISRCQRQHFVPIENHTESYTLNNWRAGQRVQQIQQTLLLWTY
jgi:hypothetical protein